jgi:glycosyltransferase involved in cell wall biosynthesis
MAHGVFSGESAPSDVRVDRYVAINEQTVNRLTDQGVSPDQIDLVRDFVDTDRFLPGPSLRSDRPRVLFLSNYKKWNNYFFAFDACAALGLEFRAVGSPYGRSREVEQDIHQADLVVSWGRGILEAMACGRAVMSYDMVRFDEDQPSQVVGDGYLTIDRYHKAREHNFGPVGCRRTFMSAEDVAEEIQQYSPNDGPVNRELAVKYHGHLAGVNQLLVCIHKARGDYAC